MTWAGAAEVVKIIYLVGDAPPHTDYQDGYDYARGRGPRPARGSRCTPSAAATTRRRRRLAPNRLAGRRAIHGHPAGRRHARGAHGATTRSWHACTTSWGATAIGYGGPARGCGRRAGGPAGARRGQGRARAVHQREGQGGRRQGRPDGGDAGGEVKLDDLRRGICRPSCATQAPARAAGHPGRPSRRSAPKIARRIDEAVLASARPTSTPTRPPPPGPGASRRVRRGGQEVAPLSVADKPAAGLKL